MLWKNNLSMLSTIRKQFLDTQFIAFVVCGGLAAVANVLSRVGFSQFFQYSIAIVLAYLVGMVTAFSLNRMFVFQKITV